MPGFFILNRISYVEHNAEEWKLCLKTMMPRFPVIKYAA